MADTLTPEKWGLKERAQIGGVLGKRRGSNFMEPRRS